MQEQILARKIRVHAIEAGKVAREAGMAGRINTIMQACFFAISGVLPREEAIERIKEAIVKTYAQEGERGARAQPAPRSIARIENLVTLDLPSERDVRRAGGFPPVGASAPDFVQRVTAAMIAGRGDMLPVSAFLPTARGRSARADGRSATSRSQIPVWEESLCIQCNKCALVCPHAAIRAKVYPSDLLAGGAGDVQVRRASAAPTSPGRATRSRSRPRTARAARSA